MTIKRCSSSILSTPFLILVTGMMILILLLSINKGFTIIPLVLSLITIYIVIDLRRGCEIIVDEKKYRFYHQIFFRKKGTLTNLPLNIKKIIISETRKQISVSDSKSLTYSNLREIRAFELNFKLADDSFFEVYKSTDYNLIYSYSKLFSNYYNIVITENEVMIDYPETGDYSDENNHKKPRTRRTQK